ncbi:MAG: hypothetical protein ACRD2A_09875, partial [Vicinamibacterales bacterium]
DDGRRQWVARYTGNSYAEDYLTGVVNPFPWDQSGEALAFSPDGRRLFMGGRTWGPEGDDYLVLAYCVRIPLPVAACPL